VVSVSRKASFQAGRGAFMHELGTQTAGRIAGTGASPQVLGEYENRFHRGSHKTGVQEFYSRVVLKINNHRLRGTKGSEENSGKTEQKRLGLRRQLKKTSLAGGG